MTDHQRIDVADAAALVQAQLPEYPAVEVPLAQALGGILRETVRAERDQPPFDRVTMDGIAIRYAGFASGRRQFHIRGTQGAGASEILLGADDACVEIMTGAALPADADTVIPVERIDTADGGASLETGYAPQARQFVHPRGSDHKADALLLEPGHRIGPTEMAVLTVSGKPTVRIAQWPKVAVISTGNELVAVGEAMEAFQIRSSNDYALAAALAQRGCPTPTRAHLPDDPDTLRAAIARLHDEHEVLVLSGGVSMGKYDYVPQIMTELDVKLVFYKVLQRPGLPMWFGISAAGKPVFALPGNPVSSLVCLIRYVCPGLLQAMGALPSPPMTVRLAEAVTFQADLTWFLPVKLAVSDTGELLAQPSPTNTSGDFIGLAGTDGVVELPRGRDEFPAGFTAPLYRW